MPPNPNVQAEFRHQLSAEQTAAVAVATAAGRAEDTRSMALRNILQTYEEPDAALQSLADGRANLEAKWTVLDGFKTAGSLSAAQQIEYDQLERQIKGNQQLEASIPTAYQRQRAEEIISYQTMEMPELAGVVNNLRERQQQTNAARDAARRVAGAGYAANADYMRANAAAQAARARMQQAENVFNARNAPTPEQVREEANRQRDEARRQTAERDAQRQAEENRVNAQRIQLEGMEVRDLRNEITRLGTEVTDLQASRTARVAAGASPEELAELDLAITRARERNIEADRVLGNKLNTKTDEINEDTAKKTEEGFAERATGAQLRDEIRIREVTADQLRTEIENLRDEIDNLRTANPNDPNIRVRQNALYDAVEQLNREEAVLKIYQDTLSKSNKAFRDMSSTERAAEMAKIGEELNMTLYNRDNINDMLLNNQDVTKEQLAAWTKLTILELVQNGRANVDMDELMAILAVRPELQMAIAQGFKNSREARNMRRAELPTNWERMWDFASNHQGWLMILLAIIAGTAGAAALAAGPIAGMVVGGAGASAAGGGAYTYGSRR